MDAFLGTILPVAFNFVPHGWAACNGQLMSISQNSALFSLLGTQYGGDGQSTFALPDLRGRVVLGQGAGPGLAGVSMGQMGGGNGAGTPSPDSAAAGATPFTALNYLICISGIYPSRD